MITVDLRGRIALELLSFLHDLVSNFLWCYGFVQFGNITYRNRVAIGSFILIFVFIRPSLIPKLE